MKDMFLKMILSLVNADKIGGIVRTWVGTGLAALAVAFPMFAPIVQDPTLNGAIQVIAVTIAVSAWSWVAKLLTAPTTAQATTVVENLKANGVIAPSTAQTVIDKPDLAKGVLSIAIAIMCLVGFSSQSFATVHKTVYYKHYYNHSPKPVKPMQSSSNAPGGDGSAVPYVAYGLFACIFGGHLMNTAYVHEVEKRKRTREDEQSVVANCVLPVLGGFLVREHWKGKKPEILLFYTQPNPNQHGPV